MRTHPRRSRISRRTARKRSVRGKEVRSLATRATDARRSRGAAVPRVVLAGVKDGVTVHDGYTAYDKPCKEASQQCYAHIKRRFERLLKKEPENKEYQSFVPRMCDLLSESMKLRTKGLSPEDFAREAKRIRQKIEKMIDSCTKDPALQNIQIWMRELIRRRISRLSPHINFDIMCGKQQGDEMKKQIEFTQNA